MSSNFSVCVFLFADSRMIVQPAPPYMDIVSAGISPHPEAFDTDRRTDSRLREIEAHSTKIKRFPKIEAHFHVPFSPIGCFYEVLRIAYDRNFCQNTSVLLYIYQANETTVKEPTIFKDTAGPWLGHLAQRLKHF